MSQGLLLIQWRTFNHLTMDQPSTFNQALESSGEGEEGAGVIWVRAERICESSFSITMKRVVTKPNKLVAKNTLCVCVCLCATLPDFEQIQSGTTLPCSVATASA